VITDLIDRSSVGDSVDGRRDVSGDLEDSLALYLRRVRSVPRLSPAEERMLCLRKERGDLQARALLIEANLRLVVWVARQQSSFGVPLLDLIQEGNVALAVAVERYDFRRGCKLSTYAFWCIRQAIRRAAGPRGQVIAVPVHAWSKIREVQRTRQALLQRLNREPRVSEIAAEAEVDARRVAAILQFARLPVSLEALDEDGSAYDLIEDTSSPLPEAIASQSFCSQELENALDALPERLRLIIELRFGFGDEPPQSLEEIGKRLGVTRERVRQLEARALEQLGTHAPQLREYLNVA
jgi:RNA polymerase primary sigma factor